MKRIFLALTCMLLLAGCSESGSNDNKENASSALETGNDSRNDTTGVLESGKGLPTSVSSIDDYIRRARFYLVNEQIGNAMGDIRNALMIDANNVDALLVLADIYYALGSQDNIILTLNKATEVAPLDSRPIIKLAEMSFIQGNVNVSKAYIDKALELNSINPQAYFLKGVISISNNDTVQALKHFMTAKNQDDSFVDPVLQIADIYAAQRNPLARDFYDLAIEIDPDNTVANYSLAMFLQDNGYPETALEIYDDLDAKMPGNYNVLFNKGYVNLVYLFNNDKAIEYFDKALEVNPKSVDALLNKGRAYEQKGNFRQAKSIYLQILKDNPNYQLAIDALSRIGE